MPVRRVLADVSNQASMTSYLPKGAIYKRQMVQQPLAKYFSPMVPKAG